MSETYRRDKMYLSKQKGNMKTVCGCPSGRTPRFLQPCLLALLSRCPSYGYELMDNLKKKGFLETEPDAGAVYRILRTFEKEGFVKSKWDTQKKGAAKRNYVITSQGRKFLEEWVKAIKAKRGALGRFLNFYTKYVKNE
jgi:poly-beta-hydroxybutyrate-responsive repressor